MPKDVRQIVLQEFLFYLGYLRRKEERIQEVENKIRAARDAKLNAEREAKAKGELPWKWMQKHGHLQILNTNYSQF